MEVPAAHLVVCLFFLGALVLLQVERQKMRIEHPESFRNIAAGVSIFALVSVLRLANVTGLLASVPFLSVRTFLDLTIVIAVITGVILLTSGVSLWLPLGRTLRLYNKLRIRHLDLLRRIEQLVGVESRLTVILEKTLASMIEHFGFSGGAVFVRSRHSRHMMLLATHSPAENFADTLRHTTIADSDTPSPSSAYGLKVGVPDGVSQPAVLLPVEIQGRVAAAFALWGDKHTDAPDDDRILLKLACEILARRMLSETRRVEREFVAITRTYRAELRQAINREGTFEKKLTAAAKTVFAVVPAEICSFTVTFDRNDTCRFTLGRPGSLLTEKGVEPGPPPANGEIGTPLIITDLDRSGLDPLVAMFHKAGMKSALSLALTNSFGGADRIVFASATDHALSARDIEFVSVVADAFQVMIQTEVNRRRTARSENRMQALEEFMHACSGYHLQPARVFDDAARLLLRESGAAAVRIAMFEADAAFIRSRALAAAHPVDRSVPSDGYLIPGLMPLHRRVRETGQSLATDEGGSTRISRPEAQQVYQADLRSALLVPIKIAGEVRGIITLAERRRPSRFSFTDEHRRLAEAMASALSIAVRLHESPWGALDGEEPVESQPLSVRFDRRALIPRSVLRHPDVTHGESATVAPVENPD